MNTCGTCKYFSESLREENKIARYTDEENAFHQCELIEHDPVLYTYGKRAYVVDASGYAAALRVKEDFGCVEWVKKEPAECLAPAGQK